MPSITKSFIFIIITIMLFPFTLLSNIEINNEDYLINNDNNNNNNPQSNDDLGIFPFNSKQTFSCKIKDFQNDPCNDFRSRINCNRDNSVCYCSIEYTTYYDSDDTGIHSYCNYQKKKQLNTFLLELFAGFGAGNFYAGRYITGVIKICIIIMAFFLLFGFPMLLIKMKDCCDDSEWMPILFSFIGCMGSIAMAFYYYLDIVEIGLGSSKDGNNIPLIEM